MQTHTYFVTLPNIVELLGLRGLAKDSATHAKSYNDPLLKKNQVAVGALALQSLNSLRQDAALRLNDL